MNERVYIETTIVSYLVARHSRDVVIAGHQQVTNGQGKWGKMKNGTF